jgi:uncharacterized membrane protein YecN with MAPEG domain
MTDPAFRREQRGVGVRMAGAALVTAAVIAAALTFGPTAALAQRLAVAILVDLTVLAWLAGGIAKVARLRFFSPTDIAGSGRTDASSAVRDASAILQNTLEQVVLAVPVHIAAAMVIDRSVTLLIALGLIFTIGRIAFWRGYSHGARARAFGFALTFYPTVATLLVVAVFAVTDTSLTI